VGRLDGSRREVGLARYPDIDAYIHGLPEQSRGTVAALRQAVRDAAPGAVECIRYDMPAFTYRGKPLIYFAAWKAHVAVYGMNAHASADDVARYGAEKGTLRFPLDEPLPLPLVRTLVTAHLAEIDAEFAFTANSSGAARRAR
jgi:uncharacterized protein YdhG (YjbR/CyaY superfamily)